MRTEQINSVGCFSGPNGCVNLNTDSFPNDTYLSERNRRRSVRPLFRSDRGRTSTIETLKRWTAPTYEVIIADRRLDNVTELIRVQFGWPQPNARG